MQRESCNGCFSPGSNRQFFRARARNRSGFRTIFQLENVKSGPKSVPNGSSGSTVANGGGRKRVKNKTVRFAYGRRSRGLATGPGQDGSATFPTSGRSVPDFLPFSDSYGESALFVSGALAAFAISKVKWNWYSVGDVFFAVGSLVAGVVLLCCVYCRNLWFIYAFYITYGMMYQTMLTIAE